MKINNTGKPKHIGLQMRRYPIQNPEKHLHSIARCEMTELLL